MTMLSQLERAQPLAAAAVQPDAGPPLDIRHVVIVDRTEAHPSQANGQHNVVRLLALEQLHAGDHARIFFLMEVENGTAEGGPASIRTDILKLDGRKIRGRSLALEPKIQQALVAGATPSTVFHIHGARRPVLLSVTRTFRKHGIPYAITVHGHYSHIVDVQGRIMSRLPALYVGLLERSMLERARFVHATSAVERDIILRLAPRANVQLISNAAYSRALAGVPPAPNRPGPSAAFPAFGFCGRYEIEHKGLDLLIDGFALYREAGGKGRLTMIGTGPLRPQIAGMVSARGLDGAVEVHGPRFGAEKAAALRGWDFFVLASRFDGLPIACLEAALGGLPLIVSIETGLAATVEQFGAGIGLAGLTPRAVADALLRADRLTPGEWKAMSDNGYRMAVATGDWTAVAARMRQLYTSG